MNGQVVFGVGECTKNITIPIIADSEREENETFNVELDSDCCADVIIGQVQVNITDDDSDGTYVNIKICFIEGIHIYYSYIHCS